MSGTKQAKEMQARMKPAKGRKLGLNRRYGQFGLSLVASAKAGGMEVPPDLNNYDQRRFPHWEVYRAFQAGRARPYENAHIDNARLFTTIDRVSVARLSTDMLVKMGMV